LEYRAGWRVHHEQGWVSRTLGRPPQDGNSPAAAAQVFRQEPWAARSPSALQARLAG
jgi:hypothetical protein